MVEGTCGSLLNTTEAFDNFLREGSLFIENRVTYRFDFNVFVRFYRESGVYIKRERGVSNLYDTGDILRLIPVFLI